MSSGKTSSECAWPAIDPVSRRLGLVLAQYHDTSALQTKLCEVFQILYTNGNGVERNAGMRIDYDPSGFTVGKVLKGDLSEIVGPNRIVCGLNGGSWPERATCYLKVSRTLFAFLEVG